MLASIMSALKKGARAGLWQDTLVLSHVVDCVAERRVTKRTDTCPLAERDHYELPNIPYDYLSFRIRRRNASCRSPRTHSAGTAFALGLRQGRANRAFSHSQVNESIEEEKL